MQVMSERAAACSAVTLLDVSLREKRKPNESLAVCKEKLSCFCNFIIFVQHL